MPRPSFTITFACDDVTRVRNLAEDLYRQVQLTGIGTVYDIDRPTDEVVVTLAKRRDFARVRGVINQQIKRHNLNDVAQLTYVR